MYRSDRESSFARLLSCMYTAPRMTECPLQLEYNRPCERLLKRLPWYRAGFNLVVLSLAFVFAVGAALNLS